MVIIHDDSIKEEIDDYERWDLTNKYFLCVFH